MATKKSRATRTLSVRGRTTVWSRLIDRIGNRQVLGRLALVLVGIAGMLVAVEAWRATFPYREGDRPQHGLSAKTAFAVLDPLETDRARRNAEEAVPFTLRNHPERLANLPQNLRAALGELAQSSSLDRLSQETRQAFGLLPPAAAAPAGKAPDEFAGESPQLRYAALKNAVSESDAASGKQRIDDIVDDFEKFISPLSRHGVLDPRDIRREPALGRLDTRLEIRGPAGEQKLGEVLTVNVTLQNLLNDAGELGRSWLSYPSLTPEIRPALSYWLIDQAPPTLVYDEAATKAARARVGDAVPNVLDVYAVGNPLVRPGEKIETAKRTVLEAEYAATETQIPLSARLIRVGVVLMMLVVLAVLQGSYIVHSVPRLAWNMGRLAIYLTALVLTVAIGRWLSFDPWRAEVIPLIATVMIIAIAYTQIFAVLTAFTISLILTLSTTSQFSQFIVLMSTATAAVIPLHTIASRSKLIMVGIFTASTYFLVRCGMGIIQTQSFGEVFQDPLLLAQSAKGAAWCLVAGYLVAGSLPFVESTFGIVTDISLLEMSDPSHPLLQELVQRAPGTYNHSITVGSIAETAADAIGANGLLVRVGAYFHDIGKMLKPQYFIENVQAGCESRHANLAPAMSTLIIIGHVKDGVDLAEQHNLPEALVDFIEQHHGTTLVEYFYREATRQAEVQPDHKYDAEESSFRYPGPKPQTREAGVLMLADAVESASRTLNDPTPKRIETLVHNLALKRLLDGQFDECNLKLSELRTIEESLVKSLIAIYHGRIRYPEAQTA